MVLADIESIKANSSAHCNAIIKACEEKIVLFEQDVAEARAIAETA